MRDICHYKQAGCPSACHEGIPAYNTHHMAHPECQIPACISAWHNLNDTSVHARGKTRSVTCLHATHSTCQSEWCVPAYNKWHMVQHECYISTHNKQHLAQFEFCICMWLHMTHDMLPSCIQYIALGTGGVPHACIQVANGMIWASSSA